MPVTDADLALCPAPIVAKYRSDPARYEAVVLATAQQRAGKPIAESKPPEPPTPRVVPWVGAYAGDAEALDAANACPFKCRTCKATKCKGGLRDGERVSLEDCLACVRRPTAPDRGHGTLPVPMVAPSDRRNGIMRGGVLQVWVGRMCNQSCYGCTQGSHWAGKPGMLTPDEYETALKSIEGYPSVVGMFGGLPTMHPQFYTLCEILRAHVPWEQRGLWANDLRGKGNACRITFNPAVSNLNCHLDTAAADEIRRDWPEATPYIKGEHTDSLHTTPWVGMKDVIPDEAERWRLIGDCPVNKFWSAMVCKVRGRMVGFFCEIAGAMAMLHADNNDWDGAGQPMPDIGVPIEPGWWRRPMADFEQQVRTCCHNCGVPMQRPGKLAIGGDVEEYSAVHQYIARPKERGRPLQLVGIGGFVQRGERPSTEYLDGTTPGYRA